MGAEEPRTDRGVVRMRARRGRHQTRRTHTLERVMEVLIVYESMYGNTHAIADAVAEGARQSGANVEVGAVTAASPTDEVDLLVVGGPTHMQGLTSQLSRRLAADAAKEDEHPLDPSATAEPGLRTWLRTLGDRDGGQAAAFDTRADKAAALTGSAARGIARRLRHHGYEVIARESFLVDDAEGPLADGELERARAWGSALVAR
jgi:RNase H-fold protein (predicted Holliday junction resolvase)